MPIKRERIPHVDDPVAVGKRLVQAREGAGLSQRDLAFPGRSAQPRMPPSRRQRPEPAAASRPSGHLGSAHFVAMAAMRPTVQGGASRRNLFITFGLAIVVAAALVVFALV